MSPKSGGRAQRRQRRNLWISVIAVVVISLGSFAAVFAAKWSPRLGLDLAGGVSVVYTAEGEHVSQADLDETVNILESPGQRARRVGRAGPDVGHEPDLGVHSRCHRRAAGPRSDRADGADVLPSVECWAYPEGTPKNSKDKLPTTGTEAIPACTSSLQLTAANLECQPNTDQATQQRATRPTVRGLSVDERGQDRLRHQHRLLPGISGACDGSSQVRCVLGPAQMTGRSIGSVEATQNQTASGLSTTRWPAWPVRRCGTRSRRRTSTSSSGSSSTGRCTRLPSSSRPNDLLLVRRQR